MTEAESKGKSMSSVAFHPIHTNVIQNIESMPYIVRQGKTSYRLYCRSDQPYLRLPGELEELKKNMPMHP